MARILPEEFEKVTENNSTGQGVKFFKLKDNGHSAIIRIMAETEEDIDANFIHEIEVDGKFRKVSCLRDAMNPTSKCPLCDEGEKPVAKTYLHLIEYVTDEHGKIVGIPAIFERGKDYISKLKTLIGEYAPLHTHVFKIVRNGKAGSKETTYDFLLQPSNTHNSETHPYFADDLAYTPALGTVVQEKTAEELTYFVNHGLFPSKEKSQGVAPRQAAPQPIAPQPVNRTTTNVAPLGPRTRV